jgi:hypothetical protein
MRRLVRTVLSLGVAGLIGCGGERAVITDPSKLKPLTEAEQQEIRRQDAKIQEEEGGQSFGKDLKGAKAPTTRR